MQQDRVKSAARVFAILEFFSEHRQPARMHEMTASLSYPVSSMTALLRTMVSLGYLEFDPDTHRYFPSPRLSRLTNWMDTSGYEQTVVLDAMHRLRERAGEPVVLGTQEGLHLEYVVSLHRYEGTNSHIKAGTRRLMIQNGIGWMILSRQPFSEAISIYRQTVTRGLLRADDYDEAAFAATLQAHAATDISVLHARHLCAPTAHWNASMVSTLIPAPDGHHRSLGVGLHGPTDRIIAKVEMLSALLRELVVDLKSQL